MATPKVLFIMADYGHDPTGTATASYSSIFQFRTKKPPETFLSKRYDLSIRSSVLFMLMSLADIQVPETAVPFSAFQEAGFEIEFATENGKSPVCDNKMLEGVTQKLLVGLARVLFFLLPAPGLSLNLFPLIRYPMSS